MKKLCFILIIGLISISTFAQSIRKNYNEMTALERTNLVNAFYQLRLGPDLINDLAVFHGAYFNFDGTPNATQPDIHFNLPDEPERDIFLAWHRQQIFELESAMKNINPYITIPYWNSSTDQSINSPLWAQSFMGQFNTDWNLNRNLGGNDHLPMPSEVNQVQSQTNFLLYSDLMERGPVHHGAHRWVGGVMSATVSPRDPVFYLHHAFIDKLWKEWHDLRQSSSYIITNMVRYDGTYVFNGSTLPSINPNSIVNSRSRGIFYADNQLAVLDNYSVTNNYRPNEIFFYQYTINAGNNFIVPNGRTARIESVNQIRLTPGFRAVEGSNFIATIGNGTGATRDFPAIVRNQIPWDDKGIKIDWDAYRPSDREIELTTTIRVFPNPYTDRINVVADDKYDSWLVELYDLTGRMVMERTFANTSQIEFKEAALLKSGTYLLRVTINGNMVNSTPIIKN